MNLNEEKYSKYVLTHEMFGTVEMVKNFDGLRSREVAQKISKVGKLLLTGEGSSRIFPAKNTIRQALKRGIDCQVITEGSRQASQYDLSKFAAFCASNSGRTKEVILLAKKIMEVGTKNCFGLTSNENTLLEETCAETFVLNCGWEKALAATTSVVEQALFYESLLWNMEGRNRNKELKVLADKMRTALKLDIAPEIIEALAKAPTIYFAGYNDGVAEELTLKTNEIARKKSDYLEGTYAVHGIEEVMQKDDVVIVIDPMEDEIEKFQEVLEQGVGLKIVAIASAETPFTTIKVPDAGDLSAYVYLCTGWNLLVETGLFLGIDLDKAERARKIGNELMDNS